MKELLHYYYTIFLLRMEWLYLTGKLGFYAAIIKTSELIDAMKRKLKN